MLGTVLILIIGLVVLILGGDFLVKGATNIAFRLHLSPLVVGLTIVAFGTSAPELLISVKSALQGSPDIAMGNVIGSNICNLALVLGMTALISPVKVQANTLKIDWPMTMGASVLLYLTVREGYVDSYEGLIFIIILSIYLFIIIKKSRKDIALKKELEEEVLPSAPASNVYKDVFYVLLGILGLYFGSEWFVGSSRELALNLGVSERVIGLTVVALGTSLPELVTSIMASMKGQTDLAIGNLMGSNIFNILSILGITSMIKEIRVSDEILSVDIVWMIGITLIVLPLMVSGRKIGKMEGALLLGIYFVYVYLVLV